MQLFAQLDESLDIVHASRSSEVIVRKSLPAQSDNGNDKLVASNAIKTFIQNAAEDKDSTRIATMSLSVAPFQHTSETLMPTSWSRTRFKIKGLTKLDLEDKKIMRKVTSLCKKQKLLPPKGFIKAHSFHYGKYEGSKLVSFLSVCIANLNKMPGSIAVSIDIAASVDT